MNEQAAGAALTAQAREVQLRVFRALIEAGGHAAISQVQFFDHSHSGHESGTNPRPKARQAGPS